MKDKNGIPLKLHQMIALTEPVELPIGLLPMGKKCFLYDLRGDGGVNDVTLEVISDDGLKHTFNWQSAKVELKGDLGPK